MGMFDYFYSSYDLGEGFTGVECQTKDMEYGIGGSLSHYWLSGGGELYVMSYSGAYEFKIIQEGDEGYDGSRLWGNYEWERTGKRGRVKAYRMTGYVEIYPGLYDGRWEDWPRMMLHIKEGRIMDSYRCKRNECGMRIPN